ncbi:hypothetical protein TKK_0003164 [Trichogramma kaykai]
MFEKSSKFYSLKELEDSVKVYEREVAHCSIRRKHSNTLDSIRPTRSYDKTLIYYSLTYVCEFSGQYVSKGLTNYKRESKKTGCPFFAKILLSKDGKYLGVKESCLNHIHRNNDNSEETVNQNSAGTSSSQEDTDQLDSTEKENLSHLNGIPESCNSEANENIAKHDTDTNTMTIPEGAKFERDADNIIKDISSNQENSTKLNISMPEQEEGKSEKGIDDSIMIDDSVVSCTNKENSVQLETSLSDLNHLSVSVKENLKKDGISGTIKNVDANYLREEVSKQSKISSSVEREFSETMKADRKLESNGQILKMPNKTERKSEEAMKKSIQEDAVKLSLSKKNDSDVSLSDAEKVLETVERGRQLRSRKRKLSSAEIPNKNEKKSKVAPKKSVEKKGEDSTLADTLSTDTNDSMAGNRQLRPRGQNLSLVKMPIKNEKRSKGAPKKSTKENALGFVIAPRLKAFVEKTEVERQRTLLNAFMKECDVENTLNREFIINVPYIKSLSINNLDDIFMIKDKTLFDILQNLWTATRRQNDSV